MKFITDNTPANQHNPLAYLDISIAGQPGAPGSGGQPVPPRTAGSNGLDVALVAAAAVMVPCQ
jgi:hypothetical protein